MDGRSPLSYAAASGYHNVVEILIDEYHASVHSIDSDGSTPLIDAAFGANENVVKILLRRNEVLVNWRDGWKEIALHKAVGFGQKSVVAALLSGGANPNMKNCQDNSTLSIALLHDDTTIIRLLLDANNISVNSKNEHGRTPLMRAAEKGDIEIVELLIRRGAWIDARDKERRIPLSYAAERGRTSVVKRLLAQGGVDVGVLDRSSRTAWSYAKQGGHSEIVKYLEDAGAFGDCAEFFKMLRTEGERISGHWLTSKTDVLIDN